MTTIHALQQNDFFYLHDIISFINSHFKYGLLNLPITLHITWRPEERNAHKHLTLNFSFTTATCYWYRHTPTSESGGGGKICTFQNADLRLTLLDRILSTTFGSVRWRTDGQTESNVNINFTPLVPFVTFFYFSRRRKWAIRQVCTSKKFSYSKSSELHNFFVRFEYHRAQLV